MIDERHLTYGSIRPMRRLAGRHMSVSPDEVVEFFRLDEGAAADLRRRQFGFFDQLVERGPADAAKLMPRLGDRHKVPHMFLVIPRTGSRRKSVGGGATPNVVVCPADCRA